MARRRNPKLKRRRFQREPRKRFVIFCEGEKTEPAYFMALERVFGTALIEVEAIGPIGVALTVATRAVEHARIHGLSKRSRKALDSFEKNDEVWAVFDRDEHPRFAEAVALCEREGIGVGRSNPCFEVWLILHFTEYEKPDDRAGVQKQLAKLCPDYDIKGAKKPNCAELVKTVTDAEERALTQLRRREEERSPFGVPSTTVGGLSQAIRNAARAAQ